MRSLRFAPLGRDLSRLVLGTAAYEDAPLDVALDVFDTFRDLGGNVVDTGREYGNAEPIVGRWLSERGLDQEIVVLTKGAHHDKDTGRKRVNPAEITQDLEASLRALARPSIDVYCLHRDDPEAPVGPILEVLNQHRRAGLIRALGASNWSTARLEEAARYAARHDLEDFAGSSPGLSLAAPQEAPWPGSVTIHERQARAWYERRQLPVFAWASLAGGFFAGVRSPDVLRVYENADNRERLDRARTLAARKGATASQVALAWVLHQPFPTYALVGPRSVAELRESVAALDLALTPAESRWLDLEEGAEEI
ncbi:MAG TPA: aldo/keto reductase [Methylomirabilota bacterium]|jgi:aryl-alcohol dehydrogenase-like predicted oxidoreductase|nr:aldo/keto reductase [Methylomirabilota bacterium]